MLGLLVAQQDDHWKQLQQWMEQLGWTTSQVPTCALGRKRLEQNPDIDLVLIDADTADDFGLVFLRLVRSEPRLVRVPIIVCGTSIDHVVAMKYGELGVDNVLLLPAIKETFEAKISKAVQNGKPRVLVVDDSPIIRDLLTEFFRLERYTSVLATSVDEALQIVHTQSVDAIVTDIMMPGRTGLDLLIEVKHDFPHIPVILITGCYGRYGPEEAIAMGADGYFAKPFHNRELIFTLRKVMGPRARPQGSPAPDRVS